MKSLIFCSSIAVSHCVIVLIAAVRTTRVMLRLLITAAHVNHLYTLTRSMLKHGAVGLSHKPEGRNSDSKANPLKKTHESRSDLINLKPPLNKPYSLRALISTRALL